MFEDPLENVFKCFLKIPLSSRDFELVDSELVPGTHPVGGGSSLVIDISYNESVATDRTSVNLIGVSPSYVQ